MKAAAILSALLSIAPLATAHEYPIQPVSAVLRVEPDRMVVDIVSDSVYWIEEVVGLHPMPAQHWPTDARDKTERYVNQHLRLAADGRALQGRLIEAAYVQRPWEVNEEGSYRLRLAYPDIGGAAVLSGAADFFEEHRQELLAESGGAPLSQAAHFATFLAVPGRVRRQWTLRPGTNSFTLSVIEARRTPAARALECVWVGVSSVLETAAAWPALLALALSLGPQTPSRSWIATGLAATTLAAAPAWTAPSWLAWAGGLAAAAAAGRWLGPSPSLALETAALALLGRTWSSAAMNWLPRAVPGPAERFLAITGLIGAATSALAAGLLAARLERRRLDTVSESRAEELFSRRRRLAAIALMLACGYGLSQSASAP